MNSLAICSLLVVCTSSLSSCSPAAGIPTKSAHDDKVVGLNSALTQGLAASVRTQSDKTAIDALKLWGKSEAQVKKYLGAPAKRDLKSGFLVLQYKNPTKAIELLYVGIGLSKAGAPGVKSIQAYLANSESLKGVWSALAISPRTQGKPSTSPGANAAGSFVKIQDWSEDPTFDKNFHGLYGTYASLNKVDDPDEKSTGPNVINLIKPMSAGTRFLSIYID